MYSFLDISLESHFFDIFIVYHIMFSVKSLFFINICKYNIKSILLMIVQLLIVLSTHKLRFRNISKTAELAGK